MRYVLGRGEGPAQVARKFGVPLCMLLAENTGARWRPGMRVEIPLPDACLPPCPPAVSLQPYEVQAGDTVASVAAQYGTTMQLLLQQNEISRTKGLQPGQKLQIPCPNEDFVVYSYRASDTPAALAARFGITLQQLTGINGAGFYPGKQLLVPKREDS